MAFEHLGVFDSMAATVSPTPMPRCASAEGEDGAIAVAVSAHVPDGTMHDCGAERPRIRGARDERSGVSGA
jgi:hypothetical protein